MSHDDRDRAGVAGASLAPGDIAIGVVIGRSSEFFDFFVYAIASVLVFPKLIFPFLDPLSRRRCGPSRSSRSPSSRGPSAPSIFMRDRPALRPRRQADGRALPARLLHRRHRLHARTMRSPAATRSVILALMRIGQGIALGGTWDGLSSLSRMNAPENERGWYAMIPQLGAPIGSSSPARSSSISSARSRPSGFPRLGLALSVLRRLRDQRRGALRPPAHRRHPGVRRTSSRAWSCSRPDPRHDRAPRASTS